MSQLDTLARLRAYAAAHPTDVKVIAATIRANAELEARIALSALAQRWRARALKERKAREAESRAIVTALLKRTLRGMKAPAHLADPTLVSVAPPPPSDPEPEEEAPFPLVQLIGDLPPASGVRARPPAGTLAAWLQSRTSRWRSTASRS